MKFGDNFNRAGQIFIELGQILGWYPILPMHSATDDLDIVSLEKFSADVKSGYVSDLFRIVLRIPITGDLHSIFFLQHRIKDRLFRQPRRESHESRGADQLQFRVTNRAK